MLACVYRTIFYCLSSCCRYFLLAIQGAKVYCMPVALTSSAVAAPIFLISKGSLLNCSHRTIKFSASYIGLLHTKRENSTQNTSLVGERAHLVYKPHINIYIEI
ncbi:hypothetical protein Hanom_Chr01g00084101 [Helianthus anomalus]